MSLLYPKNIHPLVNIACEKQDNKDNCECIYYAMKAIKSDGISESVSAKAGFLIGATSTIIGLKEGWSNSQHLEVKNSFFKKIDKVTDEKLAWLINDF